MYKKLFFPFVAAIMGISLIFSAFTTSKEPETLQFRYNLDSEDGIENPGNWQDVSSVQNPTGCTQDQDLPCLIRFTTEEYDDLMDFLDQHPTADDIFDSEKVIATKPEILP